MGTTTLARPSNGIDNPNSKARIQDDADDTRDYS